MTTVYRTIDYRTKRYRFPLTSFGVLKVIAPVYPVNIDVVYPKLPYTLVCTVNSDEPVRLPSLLVDACEVRIYGPAVTAVYLASTMQELPA